MFHFNCQPFCLKRIHPPQDSLPKPEYLYLLHLLPPLPQQTALFQIRLSWLEAISHRAESEGKGALLTWNKGAGIGAEAGRKELVDLEQLVLIGYLLNLDGRELLSRKFPSVFWAKPDFQRWTAAPVKGEMQFSFKDRNIQSGCWTVFNGWLWPHAGATTEII